MESVSTLTVATVGVKDAVKEEARFIEKNLIVVTKPSVKDELSARFLPSFAYVTFKRRSPQLIRELIISLMEREPEIVKECGEYAHFDLKRTIWSLELLRDDIIHNKQFQPIRVQGPDTEQWNKFIKSMNPDSRSWFSAVWLHAESYMYRRIWSIFQRSESLKNFDYFAYQKMEAARTTAAQMSSTLVWTMRYNRSQENFQRMLKLCVWGNRCDLSISKKGPDMNLPQKLKQYDGDLLVDQSADVWNDLIEAYDPVYVDIVCDNAGYELFTDFLLADYLIQSCLAERVRFHVKAIPWFISDVTANDFYWMLKFFCSNVEYPELQGFGQRLRCYLRSRNFILCDTCHFWTIGYDCSRMKDLLPCLYVYMSTAALVIFKGDLNYRKLLGDINYCSTDAFSDCLRGFLPTSVCALRAIKSDIYCGLPVCTVEWLTEEDPDWMITGNKAVIQIAVKHRLSGDPIA
ncbi:damage-control phosphatase ARMT1 [Drosophila bipectinata]|uniref:damage-control phosphatase ARMT1 n=1 Tax=Drosophila bipectinata TaxID=42026 RepID=UPI001C8AE90A|nr:damage-control phosphatase ARMT1 [Drosophila bipectinata]